MKLYRKINDEGLFIEDVILEEIPYIYDEEFNKIYDEHYIDIPVPNGFYKPKWTGSEWIEGMALEEIEAIKNNSINEVPNLKEEIEILKENIKIQDNTIDINLMATAEIYNMLEPMLGIGISTLGVQEVSRMIDLYVVMIQRGLKTIEQVPERYREEVTKILEEIEK